MFRDRFTGTLTQAEVTTAQHPLRVPKTAEFYDRVNKLTPSPWLVNRFFAIRSQSLKASLLDEPRARRYYGDGISLAGPFLYLMQGVFKGEGVGYIDFSKPGWGETLGKISLGQFDQGYPHRVVEMAVDPATLRLSSTKVRVVSSRESSHAIELPSSPGVVINALSADQRFLDLVLEATGDDLQSARERWIGQVRQEREEFYSGLTPQGADLTRRTLDATEKVFKGQQVLILGSVENKDGGKTRIDLHISKQVKEEALAELEAILSLPVRYTSKSAEWGAWQTGTDKLVRGALTVDDGDSQVRVTSEHLIGLGSLTVGDWQGKKVINPSRFLDNSFSDFLGEGGRTLKSNVWLTDGTGVITMFSNRLTLLAVGPNITPVGPLFE